jgi:hypothetical protein
MLAIAGSATAPAPSSSDFFSRAPVDPDRSHQVELEQLLHASRNDCR